MKKEEYRWLIEYFKYKFFFKDNDIVVWGNVEVGDFGSCLLENGCGGSIVFFDSFIILYFWWWWGGIYGCKFCRIRVFFVVVVVIFGFYFMSIFLFL